MDLIAGADYNGYPVMPRRKNMRQIENRSDSRAAGDKNDSARRGPVIRLRYRESVPERTEDVNHIVFAFG